MHTTSPYLDLHYTALGGLWLWHRMLCSIFPQQCPFNRCHCLACMRQAPFCCCCSKTIFDLIKRMHIAYAEIARKVSSAKSTKPSCHIPRMEPIFASISIFSLATDVCPSLDGCLIVFAGLTGCGIFNCDVIPFPST